MSRSKNKSSAATDTSAFVPSAPSSGHLPGDTADSPDVGSHAPESTPDSSRKASAHRRQLAFGLCLAAGWYFFLILTAALTGNPVTLNRGQLRESRIIVSGSVDERGRVEVVQIFKGEVPEGDLTIAGFPFPPGNYILPLTRVAGRIEITPSRLPDNPPLIYPATAEALEQLEALLDDRDQ